MTNQEKEDEEEEEEEEDSRACLDLARPRQLFQTHVFVQVAIRARAPGAKF